MNGALDEAEQLRQVLAARERGIAEAESSLRESREHALQLAQTLARREEEFAGQLQHNQEASERLAQALTLHLAQMLARREEEFASQLQHNKEATERLAQALTERQSGVGTQLEHSQEEVKRLSLVAQEQDRRIDALDRELSVIYRSRSWRLTAPLRAAFRWARRENQAIKCQAVHPAAASTSMVPPSAGMRPAPYLPRTVA